MTSSNPSISIIVPVYKGRIYIPQIIKQVDDNAQNVPENRVELVIYNDYPNESIDNSINISSDNLSVIIINSTRNLGIHGARVAGLQKSSGDVVMFLDQDDYIYPEYLKKQLAVMKDADVVVCEVVHAGKCHYSSSFRFENVVTADFLMNNWNSIVSPGQVLIRRNVIPDIWMNNIIRTNGADDYFLWLLLAKTGIQFKLNEATLFEHTVKGDNTSLDTNKMMDSEMEMIDYLYNSGLYSEEEKENLFKLQASLRRIHIKELEDYREAFFCYKELSCDSLNDLKDKRVGIYGAGIIGQTLASILIQHDIDVVYIDKNADNIKVDLNVYSLDNAPNYFDLIIVTPLPGREKIVADISDQFSCNIVSLSDFYKLH